MEQDGYSFEPAKTGILQKIKRINFRSWKIISIATIIAAAIIFLAWAFVSKTSGEIADFSLSPSSTTVTAGGNFNMDVILNTRTNNIVAAKAVVRYNPADFSLVGYDTSSSAFSAGNSCVYDGKPCEIINRDDASGQIIVTLAKPSPGVNTEAGLIATLNFKALRAVAPTDENITIYYAAYQSYDDSDAIFDDGLGTDILNLVYNSMVTANLPVPTSFSATGSSATEVSLAWSNPDPTVGIVGYKVYRNNIEIGTVTTTSYVDSGLTPLTAYNYRVSAFDARGNNSAQTAGVSGTTLADTTNPEKPASLVATPVSMTEVDLSWSASTDNVGVAGYKVFRNSSEIATVTTTNYSDSGLSPEISYNYTVSSFDAAGNNSTVSDVASAKTLADAEVPTTPGNVLATAVSMTQINLSWSASTDNVGVTGYNIYRDGTKVKSVSGTSDQDTGLTISTAYTYSITAYDAKNNESAHSATVSATTNSDTEAPTVPASLAATPASMTEVNLTWSASTDNVGVTGYRIFRDGSQIGTSASVTYHDTGLTRGTAYSYAVLAYDAAGNQSAQSTAISTTTLVDTEAPTVPGSLAANPVSMTEIDLTWNASTDNIGVVGYRVYRNGTMIKDTTETSYNDTGLTASTDYSYTVLAYDADGNVSAQSAPVLAKTLSKTYSISDFVSLVTDWLKTESGSPADVNSDGSINSRDLGIMMSNWK